MTGDVKDEILAEREMLAALLALDGRVLELIKKRIYEINNKRENAIDLKKEHYQENSAIKKQDEQLISPIYNEETYDEKSISRTL